MKLPPTTALALAAAFGTLGTATIASAQDEPTTPDEPNRRSFGNGELPDFLKPFDADGNGALDEEERQAARDARKEDREARRASIIERWDLDGDGILSDDELAAARASVRADIEGRRSDRFDEADTDGDGFLSPEEFAAIPAIARMAEEWPEGPRLIFNRLDRDEDGLISKREFLVHLQFNPPHTGPRPPKPPGEDRPTEDGGADGDDDSGADGETRTRDGES